jgi:multidrug efflux system membrane fusion protein
MLGWNELLVTIKALPTIRALVTIPALAACAGGAAEQPLPADRAVAIRVATVEVDTFAVPIVATGVLGARDELALSFKIGGVVRQVGVDPGDVVRAGQTLAVLELPEADAAVAQARSSAEKAERDYARADRLHANGAIARAEMEDARTGLEIARAELERAAFNRRFAAIVAPSDGTVLRRTAEPGELVTPGAEVLVLAAVSRGSVLRAGVADRDVVRIRRGDRALVRFDALPGVEHEGTVVQVGASPQASTGTYIVQIEISRAQGLVSGLIGTATIVPGDRRPTLLVPVSALVEADAASGTMYVLTAEGRAERRAVNVGPMHGDRVVIVSGVAAGEQVVTDGAAYVGNGVTVEVVR